MRRTFVLVLAMLAFPGAAHGKELTGLAVCGQTTCDEADVAGFGDAAPFGDPSAGPPPGRFYVLEFIADGQKAGWPIYYEPVSGLAAIEEGAGTFVWRRLAPELAAAVKESAKTVAPFPTPRVTGARVGGRTVAGDAASYAALLDVGGPPVVPKTSAGAVTIALQAPDANPWTEVKLLWYPEDEVLFRSPGTYVGLADGIAADVDAARPLGDGGGTTVPWIAIAVALAGALSLLMLAVRRTLRPAPKPLPAP
jgi:hypothetical protein